MGKQKGKEFELLDLNYGRLLDLNYGRTRLEELEEINTIENQKVKEFELLDLKYGRTRLDKLEDIMEDWINYNFNEHENEEEYLFAQEKMIKTQEEKQVSLEEWNTIWMMFAAK